MKISKETLRRIRNDIPINDVIVQILQMEYRFREGHLRFLCPICSDLHTSTNSKTNLARCFRCQKNLNPIDLLMTVNNLSFKQAIGLLIPMLSHYSKSEVAQ